MKFSSATTTKFAVLLLVIASSTTTEARSRKKLKFCKMDNLFNCFLHPTNFLTLITNGTGLPATIEQLDQICYGFHDYFPICVRTWFNRCGTPIFTPLFEKLMVDVVRSRMVEVCSGDKRIKMDNLRKYSHCINSKVKLTSEYRDRCIKPFSLDNEYVHEKALKEKPMFGKFHRDSCCVINRWYRCIMGMINHECGPVASDAFPYMLYYSLSDLICSRDSYDPEDPKKCPMNEIAAPADFQNGVPRGLQSNSFYSHFFSQSCPNVGYGIDNMVR